MLTTNSAEILPAGIVTVCGTVAASALEVRVIVSPTDGAAEFMATVPVQAFPPCTVDGLTVMDVNTGALIFSAAFCVTPPSVADTVAVSELDTERVFTLKVAVTLPSRTVTVAGT